MYKEQEVLETSTSKLRADLASYVLSHVMGKPPYVLPSYSCAFCIWGLDNTDAYFDSDERNRLREEDRERERGEREREDRERERERERESEHLQICGIVCGCM